MSALTDSLQRRIIELTAHQGVIQSRADTEKEAVQREINALLAAKGLLERSPEIEPVFLTLTTLKLLPRE